MAKENGSKIKKFNVNSMQTDEKLEIEGVWMPYVADCELKIARIGNPKYQSFIRRKAKPYTRKLTGSISDETIDMAEEWQKQAVAKFILLDWKNVQEGTEKKPVDIKYSIEKALELFIRIPDFYKDVRDMAESAEQFKQEDKAETVKN